MSHLSHCWHESKSRGYFPSLEKALQTPVLLLAWQRHSLPRNCAGFACCRSSSLLFLLVYHAMWDSFRLLFLSPLHSSSSPVLVVIATMCDFSHFSSFFLLSFFFRRGVVSRHGVVDTADQQALVVVALLFKDVGLCYLVIYSCCDIYIHGHYISGYQWGLN